MFDDDFSDFPLLAEIGRGLDAAMVREADDPAVASQPASRGTVRERLRRRMRFTGFLVPVAVLTVGVGSAAATLTVLTGSPIPSPRSQDVQPPMTVVAGSEHTLAIRAADPGDALPFALRASRSEAGLACVTVGQIGPATSGNAFGLTGSDGTFRTMPAQVVDGCGEASKHDVAVLGARTFAADRPRDVRTAVYGLGGDALRSASVTVRGVRTAVPLGEQGSFLLALRGYPEDFGLHLTLTFDDGTKVERGLATGFSQVTDPSGPAWKVTASGGETGTCVDLTTVRASSSFGEAATAPQVPVACGLPVAKIGRTHAGPPIFFDVRRFAPGDRGTADAFGRASGWAWHGAPARTIVWGGADPKRVRSITVRAGSVRGTDRPRLNQTFVVILPRAVPADRVKVEVTMLDGTTRRYERPTGLAKLRLPKPPRTSTSRSPTKDHR